MNLTNEYVKRFIGYVNATIETLQMNMAKRSSKINTKISSKRQDDKDIFMFTKLRI